MRPASDEQSAHSAPGGRTYESVTPDQLADSHRITVPVMLRDRSIMSAHHTQFPCRWRGEDWSLRAWPQDLNASFAGVCPPRDRLSRRNQTASTGPPRACSPRVTTSPVLARTSGDATRAPQHLHLTPPCTGSLFDWEHREDRLRSAHAKNDEVTRRTITSESLLRLFRQATDDLGRVSPSAR